MAKENVSSLVEANIGFHMQGIINPGVLPGRRAMLSSLLEKLQGSSDSVLAQIIEGYDPCRRPGKRQRRSSSPHKNDVDVDRISDLPDSILEHILSFLPVQEAINTSSLSKRWVSLWTTVPTLDFSRQCRRSRTAFASFVEETLKRYNSKKVKKFSVDFGFLGTELEDQVDSWVGFAISHQVEELCLVFHDLLGRESTSSGNPERFSLPGCLCTNVPSLKILRVRLCELNPFQGTVYWESLKVLSLAHTSLTNDLLKTVLVGTPALEYLKLECCSGFDLIDTAHASSSTLEELVVDGYFGLEDGEGGDHRLKINAPRLPCLTIVGFLETDCKLENVSSLVEANIGFHMQDRINSDVLPGRRAMLLSLLWKLQGILSICEMEGMPLPSSTRKFLTLNTGIHKWDIPGMVSLLRSSPHLQKLTVKMLACDDRSLKVLQGHRREILEIARESFQMLTAVSERHKDC
ncbi:hypothetical protein Tsubulata_002592 [Turnera subulata]|uniref:F-box domain-containing protein n=1 Tax=Turnera subulata TaxID=218843 RepID=A0A9Q0GCC9_9ROSI|nr:hypothetical protein Tsubulata_002592 [Turnera subulata]